MTSPAPYPRLLGDVGGTRARFGWVEARGAEITNFAAYLCADFDSLEAVIARYLADRQRPQPAACAIGIASSIVGDRVAMTNRAWTFSASAMQQRLGLERLLLVNDFAALARGLPTLRHADLQGVGTVARTHAGAAGAPFALVGPGTGLGVSGLLATRRGFIPLTGEGGHASLSAQDALQDRVVALLRAQFGHVSAERVLSGGGIVNLYRASCEFAGRQTEALEPAEITRRAGEGGDPACREAVELFFGFLGSFAGDLALTLGARAGVYLAGGIVPRLGDSIERSRFREHFEAKGRFRTYLASIPTWVIRDPSSLAMRGANLALNAEFEASHARS
ncbi:MAG: glucokinase [Caldimonas sp.]